MTLTEKGHESMCDLVENYAKEYAKEHAQEYAKEYVVKLLCNLVANGNLDRKVAIEQSGLSADEFDAIAAAMPAGANT